MNLSRALLLFIGSVGVVCACEEARDPARARSEMISTATASAPTTAPPSTADFPFAKQWVAAPLPSPTYESNTQHAGTCADLARLPPPKVVEEVRPLTLAKLRCFSWKTFEASKPSKTSALETFVLEPTTLAILPAELARTVGVSLTDKDATLPWSKVRPEARTSMDGNVLVVNDGELLYSVRTIARADVDGDQTNDLMLEVMGHSKASSSFTARLVVLSRTQEGEPLRVVRALVP